MTTTERILEKLELNGPDNIIGTTSYYTYDRIKEAIESVIGQERVKIDLEENVYYKNLLAVSKNIVMVIESKQWDRLGSHVWSIRNAIELCEKIAPPLSDLTPPKTKEDGK